MVSIQALASSMRSYYIGMKLCKFIKGFPLLRDAHVLTSFAYKKKQFQVASGYLRVLKVMRFAECYNNG